jgi:hypothetical protein
MNERWRKPYMNVKGQSIFWDAQAKTYEKALMTNDNQKEMDKVLESCKETSFEEIITLGGAVGCRDPKMILEDLMSCKQDQPLPKVIFNDLSEKQVDYARDNILKKFEDLGVEISYIPGQIKDICKTIGKGKPRRLIMGVYNCLSFFKADPSAGYPLCGYDEYLQNSATIGDELLIDWVRYVPGGNLVSCGTRSRVSWTDGRDNQTVVKNMLKTINWGIDSSIENVLGLQVIGRSENKVGFFLSHWYRPRIFRFMIEEIFPKNSFCIKEYDFAKGMIFVIDPIDTKTEGVVTILNNVIGNVLPQDQFETLTAVKKIMC